MKTTLKILFSENLSLENEQKTKMFHTSDGGIVSQPIWKQSHLQKVVVSGKIMGKKILLEKIKFSSVFGKSDLWAPVKCCWRDVLSGVMGYERMLLWRKFPINCVHPTASAKFSLKIPTFILFSASCLLSCVSKP